MLLYTPHCGGATNGDARIELLTVLMELSKAITERLPGGYGDVQIELLMEAMEAMAELMMEIPRYNPDFACDTPRIYIMEIPDTTWILWCGLKWE